MLLDTRLEMKQREIEREREGGDESETMMERNEEDAGQEEREWMSSIKCQSSSVPASTGNGNGVRDESCAGMTCNDQGYVALA